jgi:hypothetical protein
VLFRADAGPDAFAHFVLGGGILKNYPVLFYYLFTLTVLAVTAVAQ